MVKQLYHASGALYLSQPCGEMSEQPQHDVRRGERWNHLLEVALSTELYMQIEDGIAYLLTKYYTSRTLISTTTKAPMMC